MNEQGKLDLITFLSEDDFKNDSQIQNFISLVIEQKLATLSTDIPLIEALAAWPIQVATAILPSEDNGKQWTDAEPFTLFYAHMSDMDKLICVKTLAAQFAVDIPSTIKWVEISKGYAKNSMPELLIRVKAIVFENLAKLFADLNYSRFRELVTESERLSKDQRTRHQITLDLLEHMEPSKAQKLINTVDSGFKFNHAHYIDMMVILVQEVAEYGRDGMPQSRQNLCRLFVKASHHSAQLSAVEEKLGHQRSSVQQFYQLIKPVKS